MDQELSNYTKFLLERRGSRMFYDIRTEMEAYYKTDDNHSNNYQTIQKTVPRDDKDSNGQHASLACQPRQYANLGSPYHHIASGHRARYLSDPSKSTTPPLHNK